MKVHTCHLHIGRDGKSKSNGHGFGFFEKGANCTQVFVSIFFKK